MTKLIIVNGLPLTVPDNDSSVEVAVLTEQEKLENFRNKVFAERRHFATACFREGVITASEMKDWSPGNALPGMVSTALAAVYLDPADLAEAENNALSALFIRRIHPIITLLKGVLYFNLTDAEVDTIFEVAEVVKAEELASA